jgi:hypothetical protein
MQRQDFYGVDETEKILQFTHGRTYSGCSAPARSWGRTRGGGGPIAAGHDAQDGGQGQACRRQGTHPGDRAPAKRSLRLVPVGKRYPDREPGGEQMVRGAVDRRTLEEER